MYGYAQWYIDHAILLTNLLLRRARLPGSKNIEEIEAVAERIKECIECAENLAKESENEIDIDKIEKIETELNKILEPFRRKFL
jgi:predicted DNA-binding protein (UPF0278 family)